MTSSVEKPIYPNQSSLENVLSSRSSGLVEDLDDYEISLKTFETPDSSAVVSAENSEASESEEVAEIGKTSRAFKASDALSPGRLALSGLFAMLTLPDLSGASTQILRSISNFCSGFSLPYELYDVDEFGNIYSCPDLPKTYNFDLNSKFSTLDILYAPPEIYQDKTQKIETRTKQLANGESKEFLCLPTAVASELSSLIPKDECPVGLLNANYLPSCSAARATGEPCEVGPNVSGWLSVFTPGNSYECPKGLHEPGPNATMADLTPEQMFDLLHNNVLDRPWAKKLANSYPDELSFSEALAEKSKQMWLSMRTDSVHADHPDKNSANNFILVNSRIHSYYVISTYILAGLVGFLMLFGVGYLIKRFWCKSVEPKARRPSEVEIALRSMLPEYDPELMMRRANMA